MRILLWILAILSVIALAIWINAGAIAERGISYALGKREIPVQSYRIVRLNRGHIILRDVVLGEQSQAKAGELDLRITWKGNTAEAYDVTLKDADITLQQGEGGVTIGGLERAWSKTPVTLTGEITDIHLVGDITARYAMGGDARLQANDVVVTASREGTNLVMSLTLNGEAEGNISHAIKYHGTLTEPKKRIHGAFTGSYDMASASGKTEWNIDPTRFTPQGFTFSELAPFYAEEAPTFPMRISAKGALSITKGMWQLTPNLTFHELPLESLLASLLGEDAKVEGTIGGGIPLVIAPGKWSIKPAKLSNKGGLKIAVSPVGQAAQLVQSHPQSELVLSALGNFQVDTMTLNAKSTDDHGGVNLTWHFLGANPDLYGGKKVDFTLAVNANLEDIWISATQAETLAQEAQEAADKKGAKP